MDREQRLSAVDELHSSVEDWKGHKIDQFGELLLYGNFTVLKGDGAKDVEREVRSIFHHLNPSVLRHSQHAFLHFFPAPEEQSVRSLDSKPHSSDF